MRVGETERFRNAWHPSLKLSNLNKFCCWIIFLGILYVFDLASATVLLHLQWIMDWNQWVLNMWQKHEVSPLIEPIRKYLFWNTSFVQLRQSCAYKGFIVWHSSPRKVPDKVSISDGIGMASDRRRLFSFCPQKKTYLCCCCMPCSLVGQSYWVCYDWESPSANMQQTMLNENTTHT